METGNENACKAIYDAYQTAVKLLVKHGANLDAKTLAIPDSFDIAGGSDNEVPRREIATPGVTPIDFARNAKHAEVVEYLNSVSK
jgi:hypothetical protein